MHCDDCGSLCCFADDSTFSVASSNVETISQNLSEKYNEISQFMESNRLKLNDDKTHLMLLSTDRAWRTKLSNDSLVLRTEQGMSIKTSSYEKLLGCIVAQNLKWTEHILLNKNSLIKQLGIRFSALKKICEVSNFKTRKMLANGLFMSKLIYLIPLWGGCEDFLIKSLQVAQNKAARTVTRLGFYTSADTLLKQCGWLSVSQLAFYHTVVLLFKVRKTQQPKYLFEMTSSAENSRYGARSNQAGKLRVNGQMPKQTINCNSFKWRSVQCWNQLPIQLRQCENMVHFKKSLKTWVQANIEI